MSSFEIVLALVVLATVVAAVAGRLSAPAPSLLVLAGLAVGSLPGVPAVRVSPDVVTLVVLPPLLYAAGHDLSIRELRSVWRPVTILAVGLVLATAVAVAGVAALLLDVPLQVGFVLGAVLASTDPVAVTALARTLRLPARLETLVSAESLFNDATSLVLFKVAVGVVVAGGVPWTSAGVDLVRLGGGGAAVGFGVALAVAAVRRRTRDPVLETVITLVTPYATYALAEAAHVSGVTAVVVAAVTVGAVGPRLTSAVNRLQLAAVTGTVVFLLESVVFALIGLQLPGLARGLDLPAARWLLPVAALTGAVVLMRLLWVFPLVAVLQARAGQAVTWAAPAVATWAGTRGVVPLAAALSIPLTVADGSPFPHRELLLVLAIGVCVLTLVVQGLTLQTLTRRSGVAEPPELTEREHVLADLALAEAALARARELADPDRAPAAPLGGLIDALDDRRDRAESRLRELDAERSTLPPPARDDRGVGDGVARAGDDFRSLRRVVLAAERDELARLLADAVISDATWRHLQQSLDLEEAALDSRTAP